MASSSNQPDFKPVLSDNLLLCLAEQLKLPLSQIARNQELVGLGAASQIDSQVIADSALRLIDSYILGIKLAGGGELTDLEPVAVSSVLYDSAHQLAPMAKAYGVNLDLTIDGKFLPVSSNRQALQAALVSVGCDIIESLAQNPVNDMRLALTAHRCRYGLVAGVYMPGHGVSQRALNLGRQLHGQANQPLVSVSSGSGAGVFVADAILQALGSKLFSSRHRKLHGLGAVLQVNPQLQLI